MNEDQFMLIILTLIALFGVVMYWIGGLTTPIQSTAQQNKNKSNKEINT